MKMHFDINSEEARPSFAFWGSHESSCGMQTGECRQVEKKLIEKEINKSLQQTGRKKVKTTRKKDGSKYSETVKQQLTIKKTNKLGRKD
jgi:hypothetical protein